MLQLGYTILLLCWEIHKLLKGSTSHFGGEAFFKLFRILCKIICASSWKHGIIIKASWSLPISSIVCVVSQMWRANTFWRDSKGSKHISLKGWNLLPKIGYMSQQCYAICQKIVFHNMDFIYHPCEQITFCFANVK